MQHRVLITGGFGFVGSALLQELVPTDRQITVVDNLLSRPDVALLIDRFPKVRFIRGDIRDTLLMRELVMHQDTIVHLAAIVGAPACDIDPHFALGVNVMATEALARVLAPWQRVIFTSSTSSYGDKSNTRVTEATRLDPLTSYGIHKMMGEAYIRGSRARHIIFRPATAFGVSAMTRIDLLPNTFAYNALTHGVLDVFQPEVIRPFIHVRDFARAIMHAISNEMPWDSTYNLGNPALTVTKGVLATLIAGLAGATVTLRDGSDPDKRNYDVSFDKLLATGFCPTETFEDGFNDITRVLPHIQADYARYTTPGNVAAYLAKEP